MNLPKFKKRSPEQAFYSTTSFASHAANDSFSVQTVQKVQTKSRDKHKYHWAIMLLHWGTLITLLAAVGTVLAWDNAEDRALRVLLIDSHRQIGMLVLVSVAIRLAVKMFTAKPTHHLNMSKIFKVCAGLCHTALYFMMVALPLLGIGLTLAHNTPVTVMGLVKIPNWIGSNADLADTLTDYHVLFSWALLGIVSLHMTSALIHHFVMKDKTLTSMIPGKVK